MKAAEIREKTNEELDKLALEKRGEIFQLRRQVLLNQQCNTASIRSLRKDIARIETEKSARAAKQDQ